MTDKDDWLQERDLDDSGFDLKPPAVRLHGPGESVKHLVVKAALALKLERAGRRWDTEVGAPGGIVDVLDLGPPNGRSVVYEIETGATPKRASEKASQYAGGPVRDVIVIDPTDAPDDPGEIMSWLDNHVIGL